MKKWLQNYVFNYFHKSGTESFEWSGNKIVELAPMRLLDVGCADGAALFQYLKVRPQRICGVEGFAPLAEKARARGMEVQTFDLNGKWPYEANSFDCIHASQVIEHVHNTRMFLSETMRVLEPGGTMIMTSENLCSFLNLSAMMLGYTPFSLLAVGGWYLGNPFGLHAGEDVHQFEASMDDPAFSGITGHNRVLSVAQAHDLLVKIGFVDVKVLSTGLMPLPQWLGKPLEKVMWRRGHWLLMQARKPMK
jgi:SAM-dependent methyltransferase